MNQNPEILKTKKTPELFPPIESFVSAPAPLLHDLKNGLEGWDIAVYLLLKAHFPKCNCGNRRLARLTNTSISTVRRSIAKLEKFGHIKRNHIKGTSSRTTFPTDWKDGKLIYSGHRSEMVPSLSPKLEENKQENEEGFEGEGDEFPF